LGGATGYFVSQREHPLTLSFNRAVFSSAGGIDGRQVHTLMADWMTDLIAEHGYLALVL
jgi:hypothetical protein